MILYWVLALLITFLLVVKGGRLEGTNMEDYDLDDWQTVISISILVPIGLVYFILMVYGYIIEPRIKISYFKGYDLLSPVTKWLKKLGRLLVKEM